MRAEREAALCALPAQRRLTVPAVDVQAKRPGEDADKDRQHPRAVPGTAHARVRAVGDGALQKPLVLVCAAGQERRHNRDVPEGV